MMADVLTVTLWTWMLVSGGKEVPMGRWDSEAVCEQHRQAILSAHTMGAAASHEGDLGFGRCAPKRFLLQEAPAVHPVDRTEPPPIPPAR